MKKLMFVVGESDLLDGTPEKLIEVFEQAILGGVDIIQLRDKKKDPKELLHAYKSVQRITKKHNVPLVINDYLDLALEIKADGFHGGGGDIDPINVRQKMGKSAIVGYSLCPQNYEFEIARFEKEVSYFGIGALFPSNTKKDANLWQHEAIFKVRSLTKKPLWGIGGIDNENLAQLKNLPLDGVAVVSNIANAKSPQDAAKKLKEAL